MRLAVGLGFVGFLSFGCSGSDSGDQSFELEGAQLPQTEPVSAGGQLSGGWGMASAAVVQAPAVATAGETVDVVVELRNPADGTLLSLEPCPTWDATIAADTSELNTRQSGELPCDELREIEPGQRVRFEITVRAPAQVECRDGYDPDFYWSILDGDGVAVEATPVNIPMRASDSAPPNDCGGRAGTTEPPPDLERT